MIPKQKLYKTAYSPLFECYVKIDNAHQDDRGYWIFTCSAKNVISPILSNHLFRETELERFTL